MAEARLEGIQMSGAERSEEVVGKGLPCGIAEVQTRIVGLDKACDRAQQVCLADTWGPADEERIVCVGGQLADGQRGGMGQPVGVSDDELIECELGIRAGRLGLLLSCAHGCGAICRGWRSLWIASRGLDYVDRDRGSEHRGCASLQDASEALADPAIGLWWSLDREGVAGQGQNAQGLNPDTKDRLLDGGRELGSYLGPDVIELCAHGSGRPAPCGRKRAKSFVRGRKRPGGSNISQPTPLSPPRRRDSPQMARNSVLGFPRGAVAPRLGEAASSPYTPWSGASRVCPDWRHRSRLRQEYERGRRRSI